MKKLFTASFIALFCFGNLTAQSLSKEIPNYILAENSNFIVNIITMVSMGTATNRNYIDGFNMTEVKKISPKDYPNLDEGLFKALAVMLKPEFEALNMHPAGFFNINLRDLQNSEFMKNLQDQQTDIKPGFAFNIVCMDWEKAKKSFENDKLELKDVKPVSISISQPGEQDLSKIFMLAKSNMSAATAFEEVKKMIDKKGASYFLKEMEIDEEVFAHPDLNDESYDKMLKENASVEKFPAENELSQTELLVVTYGKKDDMLYRKIVKQLENYYPHKYKVILNTEYAEYMNKDYKYLLFGKGDLAQKTKYRDGKTTTQNVYLFYYVLKDLKTLDIYYGPDKNKLIKNASQIPSVALKSTLKSMKEFYGWKDK